MKITKLPYTAHDSTEPPASGGWPEDSPVSLDLWRRVSAEYQRFKSAVREAKLRKERLDRIIRGESTDQTGQRWGWEKFEAKMASRLQEIRKAHEQRFKAGQLAIEEAECALGPAVLPFSQWPPYSPPATPPEAVTLGWFDLDMPGGRVTAAAILPLPPDKGVLYQASGPGLEVATGAAQALLLRLCAALPRNQLQVTLIDPIGFGKALGRFVPLDGEGASVTGSRVLIEPAEIEEVLGRLTDLVRTAIQTGAAYDSAGGRPRHVLVVNSFPTGFTARACDRLAKIVLSGPEAGVLPVIVMDTAARAPGAQSTSAYEQNCVVLAEDEGRFIWRGHPVLGDAPLDLDRPPGNMLEIIHAIRTAPPGIPVAGPGSAVAGGAARRHTAALAACRDTTARWEREVEDLYEYWRQTEYYNDIGREWSQLCEAEQAVEDLMRTFPQLPLPQDLTTRRMVATDDDGAFRQAVADAAVARARLNELQEEYEKELWLREADRKYFRFLAAAAIAVGIMALIPSLSGFLLVPFAVAVATPLFRLQSVVTHVKDFNEWVAARAQKTEQLPQRLRWLLTPTFVVVTWIADATRRFMRNEYLRTGLQVVLYTIVGLVVVGILAGLITVLIMLAGMVIAFLMGLLVVAFAIIIFIGLARTR